MTTNNQTRAAAAAAEIEAAHSDTERFTEKGMADVIARHFDESALRAAAEGLDRALIAYMPGIEGDMKFDTNRKKEKFNGWYCSVLDGVINVRAVLGKQDFHEKYNEAQLCDAIITMIEDGDAETCLHFAIRWANKARRRAALSVEPSVQHSEGKDVL